MLKIFSVRINPAYGQYLYIVAAHTQEEARDLVKETMGHYYDDNDWAIYPSQEDDFSFCEIKELPLEYKGIVPTIIDNGGYEE